MLQSQELFLICFFYYILGLIGVSLGYHRMLTHKSFHLIRPLEVFVVWLGLPAGTPLQWVGNHRAHHLHSDTALDPHSPHTKGFWWAHCGWYIQSTNPFACIIYAVAGPLRTLFDAWHRPRSNQQHIHLAKDIAADAIFTSLSKPYIYGLLCTLHVLVPFSLIYHFYQWHGVLALWFTLFLIYNIGDAVDSFGHLYGEKLIGQKDEARNNLVLGLLAGGDGWHANHHLHSSQAKHGTKIWHFDFTYIVVKSLEKLGLASKIL